MGFFLDMTEMERNDALATLLAQPILGPEDMTPEKMPIFSTENLPKYVNWVERGYVTPIKNQ